MPEQTVAVKDWIGKYGSEGRPMDAPGLRKVVQDITGKTVGKNWTARFVARNPDLCRATPNALDPSHASNFNETNVGGFFDLIEAIAAEHPGGIPPEHVWNMDEKGIQFGGGRNKGQKRYLFLKGINKHRSQIRSDDRTLATILECVSAAGDVCKPLLVLPKGHKVPGESEYGDKIRYFILFSTGTEFY